MPRDFTTEVRAMLFSAPRQVDVARGRATITLAGADNQGFYKCPYMQVYVNGYGPFTFLFDTGSSYTMVSDRVVAAAHIPVAFDRSGQRDVVRLNYVRIGGVTIHDLWAIHDDGFGVDGVFGFQTFADKDLLFELAIRRLVISDTPVAQPNSFNLPYEVIHFTPNIPLQVGDRTISTLIDTGDDAYAWEVRSTDVVGVTYSHAPTPAPAVLNGANIQSAMVTTVTEPVRLGPMTTDHAALAIDDALPAPDIGYGVLRQFNVAFDPVRRRVTFRPLEKGFDIPANLSLGFRPKFEHVARVSGVIPDSAAGKSGIQNSDVLVALNGKDAARYTPRTWDALLEKRQPISVRWKHGSVVNEDKFAVYEIR